MAEEERADDSCSAVEDCDAIEEVHAGDFLSGNSGEGFEEVGVEVLGAVREAEHGGHEREQVDEDSLVMPERLEDNFHGGGALRLPGFGFGREPREDGDEHGDRGSDEEGRAVSEMRSDGLHDDS